jgi:hypothetical protein
MLRLGCWWHDCTCMHMSNMAPKCCCTLQAARPGEPKKLFLDDLAEDEEQQRVPLDDEETAEVNILGSPAAQHVAAPAA